MTSQMVFPLFSPSLGETGSLEEVVLGEHPFTVRTRICKALWVESRPLSRNSKGLGILRMVVIPIFLLKRSFPGSALGELSAIPRSKTHKGFLKCWDSRKGKSYTCKGSAVLWPWHFLILSFKSVSTFGGFCFRPAKLDYESLFSSPDFSATVCPVHNCLLCLRNVIDFLFTFCLLKGQKQQHPNSSHVA